MNGGQTSTDGLAESASIRYKIIAALGSYSPVLRWYRALRPRWLWLRLSPTGRTLRRYLSSNDLTVKRGYASGIRYPGHAVARVSTLTAKLAGSYEVELTTVLESQVPQHDLFVDIGSGDGFYCLATAQRFPEMEVIGFETDAAERALAGEMADINDVDCRFLGSADPTAIAALPTGRLFLMVDVEGYEYELCDPVKIPRLKDSTLLIEVHPQTRDGLRQTLIDRFSETHTHEVITGQQRQLADYPELKSWPSNDAALALSEGRPETPEWLVLTPQASMTGHSGPAETPRTRA